MQATVCNTLFFILIIFINFASVKTDRDIHADRIILRLALPAIASNITVPLLGLCDTAITGHLGSEIFLAAVAAGGTVFNVILWLCGFLRMGTTGLTAEAYGSGHPDAINAVFWRALSLAAVLGGFVILIRHPLLRFFLGIISPGQEVAEAASMYFSICVWGIPPLIITLSINGWFIGMQNTVIPMIISISMNLLNVIASLVAVYVLKAGFAGVAYGTLTANWTGLFLAITIVLLYSRRIDLRPDFRKITRDGGFGKFFRVSSDLFLRSACIMGVSLAVTSIGARMGDLTMAVNTLMLQFFLFFSYFMDGFSFAGEALVGKCSGAGDYISLRSMTHRLLAWSAAMAAVFMLVYFLGSGIITDFITDVEDVRQGVKNMDLFLWILPPIAVWAFIFDGFFIGLTATGRMFATTFAAVAMFAAIIAVGMGTVPFEDSPAFGNRILWSAFLSFLAVRGIGLAIQFPSIIRRMEKNAPDNI